MRRLAHSRYTVFFIAVFSFSSTQSATAPLNGIEVGRNYLDALYAFDFPELEKLLHADAVFEDPTSVAAFPGVTWRFIGRSAAHARTSLLGQNAGRNDPADSKWPCDPPHGPRRL